jgi:Tfp pilus assembly protein PilO
MHSQKVKSKLYINLLLALIIFGLIYFVIYPKYSGTGTFFHPKQYISNLLKIKKDYDGALSLASQYNIKIMKANTEYTNALNTLPIDTLNRILPATADPVLIIYELSKIASRVESNMLLANPKFSDDGTDKNRNSKKYNTLTVNFTLEGNYEGLKAFLRNLESSERIYNITSLDFASAQDSRYSSVFKYTLTVETYYLKQD